MKLEYGCDYYTNLKTIFFQFLNASIFSFFIKKKMIFPLHLSTYREKCSILQFRVFIVIIVFMF